MHRHKLKRARGTLNPAIWYIFSISRCEKREKESNEHYENTKTEIENQHHRCERTYMRHSKSSKYTTNHFCERSKTIKQNSHCMILVRYINAVICYSLSYKRDHSKCKDGFWIFNFVLRIYHSSQCVRETTKYITLCFGDFLNHTQFGLTTFG